MRLTGCNGWRGEKCEERCAKRRSRSGGPATVTNALSTSGGLFGPVADPAGPWGLGVVRVAGESEMRELEANDPVILSGRGFRYEVLPMLRAIVPPGA